MHDGAVASIERLGIVRRPRWCRVQVVGHLKLRVVITFIDLTAVTARAVTRFRVEFSFSVAADLPETVHLERSSGCE